jgi:uncharacterized protein (TIRG00374 family)
MTSTRTLWRIIFLLAGGGFFAALVYYAGMQALRVVARPHLGYMALAFSITGLLLIVDTIRWGYIVNTIEGRSIAPYSSYFVYFMASALIGELTWRGPSNILVRSLTLKRFEKISGRHSLGSVSLDKIFDVMLFVFFLPPSIGFCIGLLSWQTACLIAVGLLGVGSLGAAINRQWGVRACWALVDLVLRVIKRWNPKTERKKEPLEEPFLTTLEGFSIKQFGFILGCTMVRYSLLILRIYYLALALGVHITLALIFLGIPFAQASMVIGLTPGGLGLVELGWFAVFVRAGLPRAGTMTFLVGQRVYILLFSVIMFGLAVAVAWATRSRASVASHAVAQPAAATDLPRETL